MSSTEKNTTAKKKIFLLDAYALIYRAYFAFIKNPRVNSKGLNTSAIFGFANTLIDLINREKPSHLCVVFDRPEPTFRHEMYKEYKANRDAMPEDLQKSIPYIKKLIDAFNIAQVSYTGYEADDVIGTLAAKADHEGFEVFMFTPDKDYAQLVTENVKMYKPARSGNEAEIWDVDAVNKKFEISDPKQVIDILALWGDSSDNIPGAPGIGEKTAKKIIGSFQNIEGMYDNLEALKPKQRENAIAYKDQILMSRKLATIITNVPLTFDLEDFSSKTPDFSAIESLFNELEFRNMLQRVVKAQQSEKKQTVQLGLFDNNKPEGEAISSQNFETIDTVKHDYIIVNEPEKIHELKKEILAKGSFCFDTETTGLNCFNDQLVGVSISLKAHESFYIPINTSDTSLRQLLYPLKEVFENEAIHKIGQNLKFDILMLKSNGIEVLGPLFDTMIAHYLIEPDQKHNLNFLAEKYLNYTPVKIESLIGEKKSQQINMNDVELAIIKEYACEDADVTLQLKPLLEQRLSELNLTTLFESIEMPLIGVLAEMEYSGVTIEGKSLESFASELRSDLIGIEKKIFDLAGVEFNIASPKQLGTILFDKLQIDENAKKTKTKQYSTGEDILVRLENKHPIIPLILSYRSLRKLLNTYVETLPKLINHKTHKIHTSYNQAVAATGRLSSTDPNLQNIPIREERGREIRKAFVPSDEKHVLVSADYSQIELRLMAHMSKDTAMLRAFHQNADIHTATASKIYNCALEEVSSDQRRNAKTANFGIIYGISAFGLSQRLNIPRKEAKDLIDNYFDQFPGVKSYMDKSIQEAREKGYVTTLLGRRRILKDINSRNAVVRGMAERNAINAPIQGSAADIIKIAMIKISKKLKEKAFSSAMILQVHDELVFDVRLTEAKTLVPLIKYEMENAFKVDVPLVVDIGQGTNWLEAH